MDYVRVLLVVVSRAGIRPCQQATHVLCIACRWTAALPTSARRQTDSGLVQDWLFGMFEGAQQSVQHAIEAVSTFTGTKVRAVLASCY